MKMHGVSFDEICRGCVSQIHRSLDQRTGDSVVCAVETPLFHREAKMIDNPLARRSQHSDRLDE